MHKSIEALEARIAPAAVFTYTEADGDIVTVKTSAKVSKEYFESLATYDGDNLSQLLLSDPVFQNTNLTITVKRAAGGDGKASIGLIEAPVDLKNVIINGDVDALRIGDTNRTTAPVNKVQVRNLGGLNADSYFEGDVKQIKILGDFTGNISARHINAISIGGSVTGDSDLDAYSINSLVVGGDVRGEIRVNSSINSARIAGSLTAESDYSGTISAHTIKSISIGKSILGGDENGSWIEADKIGKIVIGEDIVGGTTSGSGAISAREFGSITVKGNVTGGSGYTSGMISGFMIGSINIGGNLAGGSDGYSGVIQADTGGGVGKIVIKGSIIGGSGDHSGEIRTTALGSLVIGKSVTGGAGEFSGNVFSDTGINLLRIGGNLEGGSGDRSGAISTGEGGSLDKIVIAGSIIGDTGLQSGAITAAHIGSASIGKNIIGGDAEFSGTFQSFAGIDSLRIGGDVEGGTGDRSGWIYFPDDGSLNKLVIAGSIIGNSGLESGAVTGANLVSAAIGGDLLGGTGVESGTINVNNLGKVSVAKNVTGGSGANSGSIFGAYGIVSVKIGKNLTSNGSYGGSIGSYNGSIGSIAIGGDLSNSNGNPGEIYAEGAIGSVTIGGNVSGSEYGSLGIFAGFDYPAASTVPAIGSVKIKGDVTNFQISAGVYGSNPGSAASIGSVNIGGNFTTSTIIAGINAGPDGIHGTEDDVVASTISSVVSRIASVVIGKSVIGSPGNPNDGYAILAQHIVELKVKGVKQKLETGPENDLVPMLLGGTDDVRFFELPFVPLPA